MKRIFIISMSSFYKATYAQEKLRESGIRASLKRLPTELIRSCGYGLYLKMTSIQPVADILEDNNIQTNGIFEVLDTESGKEYKRLK